MINEETVFIYTITGHDYLEVCCGEKDLHESLLSLAEDGYDLEDFTITVDYQ